MYSYIHIPFCESKCKYCRFASIGNTQKLKIEYYVKFLLSEIHSCTVDLAPLKSIYFGGGTPSSLTGEQVGSIIDRMKTKFGFAENIEISLEATPSSIYDEFIAEILRLGVNRISMGVQTLNKKSLAEIGREDKNNIIQALDILSKYKNIYSNLSISIDFIIGLPYVQKGETIRDIRYILEKYPCITHISVYMLEEYYDVPDELGSFDSRYDKIIYPDSWSGLGIAKDEYSDEYISIKKFLAEQGFEQYEISNFSRRGFDCQHNRAYWSHYPVIAFGLAASGYIHGERYTNSDDFQKYYKKSAIQREYLSSQDIFLEQCMFGLRTSGIAIDSNNKIHFHDEKISEFISQGLLVYKNNILKITDMGVQYMDYILQEILI